MDQKEVSERTIVKVLQDTNFPLGFTLKKSANSWWTDGTKLQFILAGFRMGFNIKEACILANISIRQYKYFVSLHPDFYAVKETCEQYPIMIAKTNVYNAIVAGDGKMSRWYLERFVPEKYAPICRMCKRNLRTGKVMWWSYSS